MKVYQKLLDLMRLSECMYEINLMIRNSIVRTIPYDKNKSLKENYNDSNEFKNIDRVRYIHQVMHEIKPKSIETYITQEMYVRPYCGDYHGLKKVEVESIYFANQLCLDEVKKLQSSHNIHVRCWFTTEDHEGAVFIIDCKKIFLYRSTSEYDMKLYQYFISCLIEYKCRKLISTTKTIIHVRIFSIAVTVEDWLC